MSERNKCQHPEFAASVEVNCMTGGDKIRHMADVRIRCAQCGRPFAFKGLPTGMNIGGAAVSADRQEARLAIVPAAKDKVH